MIAQAASIEWDSVAVGDRRPASRGESQRLCQFGFRAGKGSAIGQQLKSAKGNKVNHRGERKRKEFKRGNGP